MRDAALVSMSTAFLKPTELFSAFLKSRKMLGLLEVDFYKKYLYLLVLWLKVFESCILLINGRVDNPFFNALPSMKSNNVDRTPKRLLR